MRNLLRLIIRYQNIILFVILEIIAFILLANFSIYQRAKIFRLKHAVVGRIEKRYQNLSAYFSLAHENKQLAQENLRLYNSLPASFFNPLSEQKADTSPDARYIFSGARVIYNSTNKQYNFIILDKGSKHGVEADMAVICGNGIVGMVKETSENFSSVVSVLNRESFPNALIKSTGHFGYIEWPGTHYRKVLLKEIPIHADIKMGDTIITSGYSDFYPKGILIGTIEDFEPEEGINYNITVNLSTDFKKLGNVTLIKDLKRNELIELQNRTAND